MMSVENTRQKKYRLKNVPHIKELTDSFSERSMYEFQCVDNQTGEEIKIGVKIDDMHCTDTDNERHVFTIEGVISYKGSTRFQGEIYFPEQAGYASMYRDRVPQSRTYEFCPHV